MKLIVKIIVKDKEGNKIQVLGYASVIGLLLIMMFAIADVELKQLECHWKIQGYLRCITLNTVLLLILTFKVLKATQVELDAMLISRAEFIVLR